ncbi:hypothetical protein EMIT0158MI4_180004 [Burkholderia ambifaria]
MLLLRRKQKQTQGSHKQSHKRPTAHKQSG